MGQAASVEGSGHTSSWVTSHLSSSSTDAAWPAQANSFFTRPVPGMLGYITQNSTVLKQVVQPTMFEHNIMSELTNLWLRMIHISSVEERLDQDESVPTGVY